MSIDVWGMLSKSQEDNEKIEEAILRMIQEHEADPTAHTGENESLAAHREFGILDHKAGAVIADKKSYLDLDWDIPFVSLDAFSKTGDATIENFKLKLYVENGGYNTSKVYGEVANQTILENLKSSMLLDITCYFEQANASTAKIIFNGMGFEIENNRIRGYAYMTGMATEERTGWYNIDMTKLRNIRAIYIREENKIKFEIDGDTIGEIAEEYIPDNDTINFEAEHNRNTASDNNFYMTKLRFAIYEFE